MKYLSNITEGFDLFYDNFSANKSCAFRGTKEIKTFNRIHYGIMIILKVNFAVWTSAPLTKGVLESTIQPLYAGFPQP